MKFRGNIFQDEQLLLAGIFGEITEQGTAGSTRWEGEFEVPADAGISPGPYHLLTDDGKSADIEVINLVDPGPGRARVAYFRCRTVPH